MADFVEATLQAWDQGEGNAPLFEKPNLRALAKHLKRPPFKFLCDVILKTAAATECFRGLYSGEEVETASNKDKAVCTKEVKMAFLRKAIVALHLSGCESEDRHHGVEPRFSFLSRLLTVTACHIPCHLRRSYHARTRVLFP